MELSTNTVLYETRNQIAYITLNRPESLNALSRELGVGLDEAMDEFRDDPDLLVAILIGSGGRAFSAGMDLKERAYQIGLIQHLVEDRAELLARCGEIAEEVKLCGPLAEIAEEIKLCGPLAVQGIKRIVYGGKDQPVEYSVRLGAPIMESVQASEDAIEGPRAFSEKRRPVWKSS